MPKDLSVALPNRPGGFDALREATDRAGAPIEGVCAVTSMGQKVFHLLVSDAEAPTVRAALADAGLEVRLERDVLVLDVPSGPRLIGQVAARLAQAEVNVDFLYLATGNRIVLGVDGIDRARTALVDFKG
jgi:hypothetical protein